MDVRYLYRSYFLLLAYLVLPGCQEPVASLDSAGHIIPDVAVQPPNPAEMGTVAGTVRWTGRLPRVSGWRVIPSLLYGPIDQQREATYPNPNAPLIDPVTRGVAEVVISLRGVEASRARPWPHPPAQVEIRDGRLEIVQGDVVSRVGFVRCGDQLRMVSREEGVRSVRVRSAAFFSLALPAPHQVRTRYLTEPGLVEISEGTGRHWLRGYIFVTPHPYYTRTNTTGHFELEQVPAGKYQLIAWMPSWVLSHQDRETEAMTILRSHFRPPVELIHEVDVPAQGRIKVDFNFCTALFE